MRYLLGIVNSKLISFIFPRISNKILSNTFPRISVGDIRNLPIRTIDFTDPADVKRHDRMVSLVESMLDLHKQLAAAQRPDHKEQLDRQIAATDRQIDALVYELYDLTPDEITIIESS